MFCQTIQLHQLTLSLHRSCIQCTGGQEHTAERGEGAGLPLLAAAHQSTASAARRACPQLAPSSDGRCGKCMFGKVTRSEYSFQRAVYQHTWNLISAQMSLSLSKQMGHTTNGYSLQSLPCSSWTAWRRSQCLLHTVAAVFRTVMFPVLFISSSSVPILNDLKLVFYHKRIKTTPEHQPIQPNRSFTTDRSAPEGRIQWLFYPALPNPWAWC